MASGRCAWQRLQQWRIPFLAQGLTPRGVEASGDLDLPHTWAAHASYRHFWSDALRSSFVLSGVRASNSSSAAATLNKSAQSAHINLIWTPVRIADVGIEYIYGRREIENGQTGKRAS